MSSFAPVEAQFQITVGMKPYQKGKGNPPQTAEDVRARKFDAQTQLTQEYRAYLRGSDVFRYRINPQEARFIRFGEWLAEPRMSAGFDAPQKVLVRQTGDSLVAAVDSSQFLCMNNLHVLVPRGNPDDVWYLVALMNSKLLNWCYQSVNPEMGEGLAEVKRANVARLPLPRADEPTSRQIARIARSLTSLIAEYRVARANPSLLEERIVGTRDNLDELIYGQFGLSAPERAIVVSSQADHTLTA